MLPITRCAPSLRTCTRNTTRRSQRSISRRLCRPWTLAKDLARADELAAVIYNALEAIRIIALFMQPFMPSTSADVWRRIGAGDLAAVDGIEAAAAWGGLAPGSAVEVGEPLFPRLDADKVGQVEG